jgi:hypothetical protein
VTRYGYFLSSEEYDPAELVRQAKLAEAAGFEALAAGRTGREALHLAQLLAQVTANGESAR